MPAFLTRPENRCESCPSKRENDFESIFTIGRESQPMLLRFVASTGVEISFLSRPRIASAFPAVPKLSAYASKLKESIDIYDRIKKYDLICIEFLLLGIYFSLIRMPLLK